MREKLAAVLIILTACVMVVAMILNVRPPWLLLIVAPGVLTMLIEDTRRLDRGAEKELEPKLSTNPFETDRAKLAEKASLELERRCGLVFDKDGFLLPGYREKPRPVVSSTPQRITVRNVEFDMRMKQAVRVPTNGTRPRCPNCGTPPQAYAMYAHWTCPTCGWKCLPATPHT